MLSSSSLAHTMQSALIPHCWHIKEIWLPFLMKIWIMQCSSHRQYPPLLASCTIWNSELHFIHKSWSDYLDYTVLSANPSGYELIFSGKLDGVELGHCLEEHISYESPENLRKRQQFPILDNGLLLWWEHFSWKLKRNNKLIIVTEKFTQFINSHLMWLSNKKGSFIDHFCVTETENLNKIFIYLFIL